MILKLFSPRQISGNLAEDEALVYLQQNGLQLITRNFRCKGGEIDLIMSESAKSANLVFVEVRQRADQRHGGAAASVTRSKQQRLIIAAQFFLQRYREPPACRFDVIAIEGKDESQRINWIKNAFETY
ncbi:MAG: YraN family protein [Glaciimonas sp.]|nr:YraN family protein [Glaciimonas sp.]